jgi:hypothetical protein
VAGLVPAIHVFEVLTRFKTWMPGTRPGMTREARYFPSNTCLATSAAVMAAGQPA